MKIDDSDYSGGHEIDPNLVEIADMLRIQGEMHEVTEQAQDRMRDLIQERRPSSRPHHEQASRPKSRGKVA